MVVTWLLDDENEPRADRVPNQLVEERARVPQLWHLETRNSLLTAVRRGRLSMSGVEERLAALKSLPIPTNADPDLRGAFYLARTHGLTIYDALYLELAKREGAMRHGVQTVLIMARPEQALPAYGCSLSNSHSMWGGSSESLPRLKFR